MVACVVCKEVIHDVSKSMELDEKSLMYYEPSMTPSSPWHTARIHYNCVINPTLLSPESRSKWTAIHASQQERRTKTLESDLDALDEVGILNGNVRMVFELNKHR